jgi:cytidyltransferase-like protein
MERKNRQRVKITRILSNHTAPEDRIIRDLETLLWVVKFFKTEGKRIILTYGVFDWLHLGHALYLEAGKQLGDDGDIFIIGVDSDELTKDRKGPSRPYDCLDERTRFLLHFRHTDIVAINELNEDRDYLVKAVKPDILLLSESTKDRVDFVESKHEKLKEFCGKIIVLPPQSSTSTSARERRAHEDGFKKFDEKFVPFLQELFGKDADKYLPKIREFIGQEYKLKGGSS